MSSKIVLGSALTAQVCALPAWQAVVFSSNHSLCIANLESIVFLLFSFIYFVILILFYSQRRVPSGHSPDTAPLRGLVFCRDCCSLTHEVIACPVYSAKGTLFGALSPKKILCTNVVQTARAALLGTSLTLEQELEETITRDCG